MRQVAAAILNRNMPQLADELGEWIMDGYSDLADLYVLENGSDPDKYSKFASIFLKESLGPAGGVNEALSVLTARGYEYIWFNYNDARYLNAGFVQRALEVMEHDKRVGIFFPWWKGNMWPSHQLENGTELLRYSDILSFVVSRKALEVTAAFDALPNVSLSPFWDSSNFTAHYNMLATTLALYREGLSMVADRRFGVYEQVEDAAQQSEEARGFSDEAWKSEIGPRYINEWVRKAWPDVAGGPREVRAKVLREIDGLILKHFSGSLPRRERVSRKIKHLAATALHG